jgi:preprotein translocase subunit SecD
MKTITYSLIVIFILSIIAMGFTHKEKMYTKKSVLIQMVGSHASPQALSESAQIISARLKDFSTENFDMTIIDDKNEIKVSFSDSWDMKFADSLLTEKGGMAFYETYERKGLSGILKDNDPLFSLLNSNDTIGKIGCTKVSETGKINDHINTLDLENCKFAWSQNFDDTDVCLYALKTSAEKAALLDHSDIESVKFCTDKITGSNEIEITLKKEAVQLWADATKKNINKSVAIVLGDHVISAPVIRSVIDGGHCMITGGFTKAEAKYIAALGNNGELPASFKIIK